MRKHIFNAGPAVLPQTTLENTSKAVLDYNESGISLMEISHRSKEFTEIMDETISLFKELLNIPEGYSVLLMGGGASLQFCMVPYNLMKAKAAYLNTGSWATKALQEAKLFGEAVEVASSKDANYNYIPKGYEIPKDADYFHITTNNTIYGTEIKEDLDVPVTLVADASSDIFSRPVDVSKYGVIYGGAQKNLGPAGLGFIIIKNDILGKVDRPIPTLLNYQTHIDKNSLFHTPPVTPIYGALQTLKWYKSIGGLKKMQEINKQKADMLYDKIDSSKMFKGTVADKEDRSVMNITFVMNDEFKELESKFIEFAGQKNIVGIKGHRSVGGFRASMYNALPVESVKALIDAMNEFEKQHA